MFSKQHTFKFSSTNSQENLLLYFKAIVKTNDAKQVKAFFATNFLVEGLCNVKEILNAAFIEAAKGGYLESAKCFVHGVDINYADGAPLRFAVLNGHTAFVEFLLENESKIHVDALRVAKDKYPIIHRILEESKNPLVQFRYKL